LLVLSGLLSSGDALIGIASGVDVYLFLAGMMLLAEIARHEGFFNWAAAVATVW
jgi:arsenical pump membrane protein